MLETLSGRISPRLRMDDRRLAAALAPIIETSLKKGNSYDSLTYDGTAPVSIDRALRFAEIMLDVEVKGDTVLLLSDIVSEEDIRNHPSDCSISLCFHNLTENKMIISLANMVSCITEQVEFEVEPLAAVEINIYCTPNGRLFVVAGGNMHAALLDAIELI